MVTAVVSDTERPPLRAMGVVAAAILVRLLHSEAEKELSVMVADTHPDSAPSLLTLLLSGLQVMAAASVFRVTGLNFSSFSSNTGREAAITGMLGYVGGLFLSNYLLWTEGSAMSACIAVLEPVACMVLLYVVASVSTVPYRAWAVVCVCLGAALLTVDFTTVFPDSRAVLRLIGCLCLLVRNIVVKHLYDSGVSFSPRSQNNVVVTVAVFVTVVVGCVVVWSGLGAVSVLAVVAGVLSVTLVRLVLALLALYDTLTVAVFMLGAQVLENMVVSGVPHPGVIGVVMGAAMFAVGYYAYFKDGLESGTVHLNIKQVGVNELLTRLQFVLYAGGVVGVTLTLLRPTLSQRDLTALSYLGLDRLARRLLNVHPSQH
ncbi:hypothetical protein ACOMHN_015805 [Nucella lapillus]